MRYSSGGRAVLGDNLGERAKWFRDNTNRSLVFLLVVDMFDKGEDIQTIRDVAGISRSRAYQCIAGAKRDYGFVTKADGKCLGPSDPRKSRRCRPMVKP